MLKNVKINYCVLLTILCILYFLYIFLLGLDRHWSLKTSISDTGVFDQAIWNTLNGKFLHTTINDLEIPMNWLGFHFHPILLIFLPLYKIIPAVEWFIFAQAFFITITVIPVYKYSLLFLSSQTRAFLWSLSFLLNPFVISAAIWDFHPISIATPFIAWSIYNIKKNNFLSLFFCCVLILLCKEHFSLLVMGLAFIHWKQNKNYRQCLLLLIISIAQPIFYFLYLIPELSPTGDHVMISPTAAHLNRYGWLGSSFKDIVYNVIFNPLHTLKTIFFDLNGAQYLLLLLSPFALIVPLLGFEFLIIGSSDLVANLLSSNSLPKSILGYHSLTLIPIIIAASINGLSKVKLTPLFNFLIIFSYLFSIFKLYPLFLGTNSFWQLNIITKKTIIPEQIHSIFSSNNSVSIQNNLAPHFTHKSNIYHYPSSITETDYILLNIPKIHSFNINSDSFGPFHHYTGLSPIQYLSSLECSLTRYHVEYFNDPWIVLSLSKTIQDTSLLFKKIHTLKNEWQVDNKEYERLLNSCRLNNPPTT